MKKLISLICGCLILAMSFGMLTGCGGKDGIVIGSKDFTEQDILGNMLNIYISENTDIKVSYKNEMSSNIVFSALKSGSVDMYIDYTGTVYGNYLEKTELKTADEVYKIVSDELKAKFNLQLMKNLGFNNTYTLSVMKDTADRYNLQTYTDLAKVSSNLVFGGTFEIIQRPDGIPGLETKYNMSFKEKKGVDGILRYSAIREGTIDVTDAFSTDGMLEEYQLVVLEDDLNFFPPYHAVPIIRVDALEKYPELLPLLEDLENILDESTMRFLNYSVDARKENAKDVAREFLLEKGLIG